MSDDSTNYFGLLAYFGVSASLLGARGHANTFAKFLYAVAFPLAWFAVWLKNDLFPADPEAPPGLPPQCRSLIVVTIVVLLFNGVYAVVLYFAVVYAGYKVSEALSASIAGLAHSMRERARIAAMPPPEPPPEPPPPPLPPPPPPTQEELAAKARRKFDTRMAAIKASGLEGYEREAAEQEAKKDLVWSVDAALRASDEVTK